MNPGGFKGDDAYGVNDVYTDYTVISNTSDFWGVDVYDVYTDNTNQ